MKKSRKEITESIRSVKPEEEIDNRCIQQNKQASSTIYQVHLSNCQIGNNNTLVQSDGGHSATSPRRKDDGSQKAKNHAGILILKTIFESNENRPILFADLELQVKEYVHTEGLKSFKTVTGWALNDFLIKNRDQFDTFNRKQRKYVKLRHKRKHNIVHSSTCLDKYDSVENSMQLQDVPNESNNCAKDETDARVKQLQPVTENWKQVKQRQQNQVVPDSKSTSGANSNDMTIYSLDVRDDKTIDTEQTNKLDETTASNIRKDWSPDRVDALIRHGEKRDLAFVLSIHQYIDSPNKLSLDIVSMWNTPHRSKSYIIIGMIQGNIIGVDDQFHTTNFENLFQTSYFSQKPLFNYYNIEYNSKCLLVIEILSSCGFGSPCVVEKNFKVPDGITIKKMQVWVRKSFRNVVCESKNLPEIYSWFSGHLPKHKRSMVSETGVWTDKRTNDDNDEKYHMQGNLINSNVETRYLSGETLSFFWESVKGFQKGHFVLLVGDIACDKRHLHHLAKVPWICVYDFDIFSYSDGLLNAMQDSLNTERHLSINTWNEPAENISELGTRWCFMRGRQEMGSTRTDLKDNVIEDTNIWFQLAKRGIQNNCEKLANFAEDYTVPTVVFLWPKTEKLVPFMVKFLSRLTETLTSSPNLVLCMNRQPETNSGRLKFETLCDDFGSSISVCYLQYEQMCIGISEQSSVKTSKTISYELPRNQMHESPAVSEKDATWLREDFEVLFVNNPYDTSNISSEEIQNELTNFSKGGSLPWYTWYSGEAETSVIERGIEKDLEEKISKHLEDYRTSMITLCHAPGSGGTTLAQKILWHFHRKTPCVHLKLRTVSNVDELNRKNCFLYDRTDLPVLLLIDGEEESKVRLLSRQLKYTVILYIKRYPYKIHFSKDHDRVYMSGIVSSKESLELETKLGVKCGDENKRARLHEMTIDIKNGRSNHCMYEYGMTVYLHEFKGIVSYVEGYLELDKNPTRDLNSCQKCLGFLALVYYYGQSCVPCQFFSALFNKPSGYNMTLEDFPPLVQEFVVYDKNEGKRNNIRICHYIIAKEILEQILSRHVGRITERNDTIGKVACHNLAKFCKEFIEYSCSKKTKVSTLSTTIRFILTKTFIFRDEKDMSDNEEQVRKKPVLSKLMIDIPGGKPLFTERLLVLQKLTESFPDDPNYCAHLGRFYAFCRPNEENEAEKCFRKAIKICEDQIHGKRDEDIDDGIKLTMMHIYHMYGIMKQRCMSKYTDRTQKERIVTVDKDFLFHEITEELVPIVETACEYFKKSRDITPPNHDVYTYAYTGEIQSRLQFCDFVNRHFRKGENGITQFLSSDADQRSKLFVQKSFSVIENLIYECYMDVILMDRDSQSLRRYVVWYNTLFQKQILPLDSFWSDDMVSNRRLKIAAKKLKYGKTSNILSGVETIDDEKELEEIIHWYEENFTDIQDYGFQEEDGKKELERDYRDWIYAIRLDKFKRDYSLEVVLSHVQQWNDKLGSPISTFYLFILKSLLGFGTEQTQGKTECLIEALDCRERLVKMNNLIIRPKYPREWLGSDGEGIKRLKSGNRYVGIYAEDRETSNNRLDLAVCKGTICRPNTNKVNGMIALDLGANTPEVRVYFIPKIVRLEGTRFAGHRVEFNLAFSFQNGFEAYNVKILKRYGCSHCSRKLEFTSCESTLYCKCGRPVQKDELNEVK
ncbi:uncharacterized protein LOC123529994 [Mercenaria mercenaria]|uniref:uncharacterized protein LOC123529994 n=1 Tax=Mercenaria mercenaria TaxID=6596 RepID=UPI00234F4621|nr:uncharacterized protein LOC123529994 [Mercenaria mercenaria]